MMKNPDSMPRAPTLSAESKSPLCRTQTPEGHGIAQARSEYPNNDLHPSQRRKTPLASRPSLSRLAEESRRAPTREVLGGEEVHAASPKRSYVSRLTSRDGMPTPQLPCPQTRTILLIGCDVLLWEADVDTSCAR